jgi:hypothetical protein
MESGCHIVGVASPPGESLDVEQIGSVYEGIMGYTVNRATRISIGVNSKPKGSKHSTTVVVDVEGLLAAKPGDRAKLLKEWANCELAANAAKGVKEAQTILQGERLRQRCTDRCYRATGFRAN